MLKSLKSINQFFFILSATILLTIGSSMGPLSHGDSLVGDSKPNWFFGFSHHEEF